MSWICEWVFVEDKGACSVPPEEELQRAIPLTHARRVTAGSLTHPQMGCRAMRAGLQGKLEEDEEDDDDEESSPSSEVSSDALDLEQGSYSSIFILEQTSGDHPMSLGIEYQGMAWG